MNLIRGRAALAGGPGGRRRCSRPATAPATPSAPTPGTGRGEAPAGVARHRWPTRRVTIVLPRHGDATPWPWATRSSCGRGCTDDGRAGHGDGGGLRHPRQTPAWARPRGWTAATTKTVDLRAAGRAGARHDHQPLSVRHGRHGARGRRVRGGDGRATPRATRRPTPSGDHRRPAQVERGAAAAGASTPRRHAAHLRVQAARPARPAELGDGAGHGGVRVPAAHPRSRPRGRSCDTTMVIPIPQTARGRRCAVTATRGVGEQPGGGGGAGDGDHREPAGQDVPAPRATFQTTIPRAGGAADSFSVAVTAVDENAGGLGGRDGAGHSPPTRPTADTLRVYVGRGAVTGGTFRFGYAALGLEPVDTASGGPRGDGVGARPAGNCGAATTPNTPQQLACVAGPQGARLTAGPGRLVRVFVARGRTLGRPNGADVVADLVADRQLRLPVQLHPQPGGGAAAGRRGVRHAGARWARAVGAGAGAQPRLAVRGQQRRHQHLGGAPGRPGAARGARTGACSPATSGCSG